jgi:peptide/nickel transport system ATP-binding protein
VPKGTKLEAIPGAPPQLDKLPPGCAFAPRCKYVLPECTTGEIPNEVVSPDRFSRCIRATELAA